MGASVLEPAFKIGKSSNYDETNPTIPPGVPMVKSACTETQDLRLRQPYG